MENPRCGADNGREDGEIDDPPPGTPRLVVFPEGDVFFDGLQLGDFEMQTIRLLNGGGGVLEIEEIHLTNSAFGQFSVRLGADSAFDSVPATLVGGREDRFIGLDITYQPLLEAEARGEIHIRSNDPAAGDIVVLLGARPVFPCVQVRPLELDFRLMEIGDESFRDVLVTNCGDVQL